MNNNKGEKQCLILFSVDNMKILISEKEVSLNAIPLKKKKNYGLDCVIGKNEPGRARGKVH